MWGKENRTQAEYNIKYYCLKPNYSDYIETEINEEDNETPIIYLNKKYDTISSNAHERLMTFDNTYDSGKIKLLTESSNVSSIKRTVTYWLKEKSQTSRSPNPNEAKELNKKIKQLQRLLTKKKDCLKEKIKKYNIVKQTNSNMKTMIAIKLSSMNN